ncbi:RecName: Full=Spherulin-4; Flags: Precursor [Ectocarpus siliculosus]|uniref:Spherulation-specific family 4 n=1 Tax=Ectocarpus siliculosus TaxID=2880 RepID=D8LCQ3_ECTSI|nr:RecName: Full=Spherulin-4; Flags: Precursor [Ectocarpus siliculosus]|eukprot:CBN79566.1 RecName: Full=Spherulin-4; Flags: Precursor [Ectocarpus siliculosus]
MKLLVPLYIYPLRDDSLAREWQEMKDAGDAGVSVVAIANPGSGPGTEGDRGPYSKGMQALRDSGVEVIGYVASGYGRRSEIQVKADIDRYKEWYGEWLSGIFLDEAACVFDDASDGDGAMCARYRGYHQRIRELMGDSATVVMNTGSMITEKALTDALGPDVVWNVLENSRSSLEKDFGKVATTFTPITKKVTATTKKKKTWKMMLGCGGDANAVEGPKVVEGTPPAAPPHVQGRAGFMVHGAARMSYEEICHWVNQLEDGGWSHVYMTDKIYDPDSDNPAHHNPWDAVPTYWADLAKAVGEISGAVRRDFDDGKIPPTTAGSSSSSKAAVSS